MVSQFHCFPLTTVKFGQLFMYSVGRLYCTFISLIHFFLIGCLCFPQRSSLRIIHYCLSFVLQLLILALCVLCNFVDDITLLYRNVYFLFSY